MSGMAYNAYLDAIGSDSERVEIQRFDVGKLLFEQGRRHVAAFLICSGAVMVDRLLEDGRRYVSRFALGGDLIGLSVFERERFTAHALMPVEAIRIDVHEDGLPEISSAPQLSRLLKRAGTELDTAYQHMITLGQKRADERLASFLIDFADRWRKVHGPVREIPFPMTRRDIAEYLGLTIETVSRNMTILHKRKLIFAHPHRYEVLDRDGLAAVAKL